jgi:hypothetical protein
MAYLSLSILGGTLFLLTAILDYYWSRIQRSPTVTAEPTHPREVPVGSKPPSEVEDPLWTKVEPRYAGYLLAILLQLPALFSQLGWV